MIVLFRPQFIPDMDFDRLAHCWMRQGELVSEPVVIQELTSHSLDVAWDNVMQTPGRMVVWALPHFIPDPTFFEELDLYLDEQFRLVLLRNYEAVFQPGADRPHIWRPDGTVSSGLVVFQLNGQRRFSLPRSQRIPDYWDWLAKKESKAILRLPQRYCGLPTTGPMARSNLGTLVPDCWSGSEGVFGRVVTGDMRWYSKQQLRRHYLNRLESWELWLEKQK